MAANEVDPYSHPSSRIRTFCELWLQICAVDTTCDRELDFRDRLAIFATAVEIDFAFRACDLDATSGHPPSNHLVGVQVVSVTTVDQRYHVLDRHLMDPQAPFALDWPGQEFERLTIDRPVFTSVPDSTPLATLTMTTCMSIEFLEQLFDFLIRTNRVPHAPTTPEPASPH